MRVRRHRAWMGAAAASSVRTRHRKARGLRNSRSDHHLKLRATRAACGPWARRLALELQGTPHALCRLTVTPPPPPLPSPPRGTQARPGARRRVRPDDARARQRRPHHAAPPGAGEREPARPASRPFPLPHPPLLGPTASDCMHTTHACQKPARVRWGCIPHPPPLPSLPHVPVPAAAQEGYPASAFFRCDDDHLALHNGRPCRVAGS